MRVNFGIGLPVGTKLPLSTKLAPSAPPTPPPPAPVYVNEPQSGPTIAQQIAAQAAADEATRAKAASGSSTSSAVVFTAKSTLPPTARAAPMVTALPGPAQTPASGNAAAAVDLAKLAAQVQNALHDVQSDMGTMGRGLVAANTRVDATEQGTHSLASEYHNFKNAAEGVFTKMQGDMGNVAQRLDVLEKQAKALASVVGAGDAEKANAAAATALRSAQSTETMSREGFAAVSAKMQQLANALNALAQQVASLQGKTAETFTVRDAAPNPLAVRAQETYRVPVAQAEDLRADARMPSASLPELSSCTPAQAVAYYAQYGDDES